LESIRAQHNCLKSYRNVNIYPYLRVLNTEQYVDIIIQEVRKLAEGSETFSPTVNLLYRNLANQVRLRYYIIIKYNKVKNYTLIIFYSQIRYQIKYKKNTKILEKVKAVYSDYCSWYINSENCDSQNTRQKWQQLVHKYKGIGADIVSFAYFGFLYLNKMYLKIYRHNCLTVNSLVLFLIKLRAKIIDIQKYLTSTSKLTL